jgi:hypothetical protein
MKDEAALPRLVLGDVVRIQKATTKFYQGKLQLSLKKDDFRFLAFNSKRLRVEILRKLAWGGVLEIHHPKCRQQIRFSSATRVAVSDYDFKRLAELRKFASQKLELGIELTSPRPYLVKLKDLLPPFASVTVVAQLCNVSSEEKDSCVLEIMDGSVPPHVSKSQVAPGRVLVRAPGSTKEQIAALLHKWVLFSGLFSLPESEGGECRVGLKASPHAFCLLSDDDEDVQERLDGLCRQGWPFVCQRRIDMAATPNDVTSLCSGSIAPSLLPHGLRVVTYFFSSQPPEQEDFPAFPDIARTRGAQYVSVQSTCRCVFSAHSDCIYFRQVYCLRGRCRIAPTRSLFKVLS